MKKILLSSAVVAASLLSPVAAESFSGVFAAAKGSVLAFNKATLSDLSKSPLNSDVTKAYGDFGFNGGAGAVELGYSYRFANNFVAGLSLGGGFKHHTIKEARAEVTTTGNTEGKNVLGLDFVTSGLMAEARLRLGMAFGRFHVYLNPGVELAMTNPELTVSSATASHKVTYATDKAPDWKERTSFVGGLNVEYALTQTMFVGGSVGFRCSFADVNKQSGNFAAANALVTDIAYKNPYGVEVGVVVGASF